MDEDGSKMKSPSFSDRVMDVVRRIPEGRVMTYADVAHALGCGAYRAVGQAMKNNRHGYWTNRSNSCRVPCHRVVAADGKIGGYSRGLGMKKRILESEGLLVVNGGIVEFEKKRVEIRSLPADTLEDVKDVLRDDCRVV